MRLAIFMLWLAVCLPSTLRAQTEELASIERPEALGSGTLALAFEDRMLAAPLLDSDFDVAIGGMLMRARLRQTFENTTGEWLEGVYVFPLPDGAQVDHLDLVVGERRIQGVVRERQQARSEYVQARSQGRRAGLVESERPNLFTTSVANIGPGERVTVEIAWQQLVSFSDGRFSARLPLVIGPRYVPHAQAVNDPVDTQRISPIVRADSAQWNPVSIRIRLDAGVALREVRSLYHPISQTIVDTTALEVSLSDANVPANRDFVLEWQAFSSTPATTLYREHSGSEQFSVLQFFPPQGLRPPQLPRDIVFVIDTSGSMDGTSIRQAREALLFALDRLSVDDRFNVIRFASETRLMHPRPVDATAANLSDAARYVRGLTSGGGTEMFHALNAALRQFGGTGAGAGTGTGDDAGDDSAAHYGSVQRVQRVQQVVFMTDGNVGNEQALFDLIRSRLGNTRLYTVGIGSAPNGHFMAQAARYGRGVHTFVGDIGEVSERMTALFEKISAPVLTDIELEWPDGGLREIYPQRLADLFADEPMLVAIKGELPATLTVRGRMVGSPWSQTLTTTSAARQPGVGKFWAAQRIAALLETHHRREPGDATYDAVVDTALEHSLVSRYTSLVAVDETPARTPGQPLYSRNVPVDLPAGWRATGIGTRLPGTATSARIELAAGAALLLLAVMLFAMAVRLQRRSSCCA